MSKIASFQLPSHNSPTHWLPPFKLCDVFGSTHAPGRKMPIWPAVPCMVPTVQHHAQSAPSGNGGPLLATFAAFFFCPPATGYPGWRSGNARARCAGLRTPLGSCAAWVRRAAESAAAPAADHGRVRDGWHYEHQCHRAPSRGRLRRARQPQLRRSATSTFTRS